MSPRQLPFLFGGILLLEIATAVGLADYRPTSADTVLGWLFAFAASIDAWSKS